MRWWNFIFLMYDKMRGVYSIKSINIIMKAFKHNALGFTMIELVVAFALFGIFIVLVWEWFASKVITLNGIRSRWEEQEVMLYDGFSINELLANTKKIIPSNSNSINSWVLFEIDSPLLTYPYLYLGFYPRSKTPISSANDSYLWLKKIVLLNDFISIWSKVYYTSPGENMVKEYGSTNAWGSWILNNPTWFTSTGGVTYISDTWNNCIRTFSWSWIGSCVVWKQNTPWSENGLLISPTYMAIKWNDLYIADTYSHSIRKTSILNSGVITTVFWNWNASDRVVWRTGVDIGLHLPSWLAFSGNFLYVADSGNHRILKLDTITGSWRVLVGNGTAQSTFLWPVDWVTNTSITYPIWLKIVGNMLYFSESTSWLIKSIDLTTWSIRDEVGNLGNIAYFWDFEVPEIGTSYGLSGWSGQIIGEAIQTPYSGEKLLEITSNTNSVSFNYWFSWSILKRDQSLDFRFALKSNSGWMIEYGPSLNQTFLAWKTKTWSLSDQWTKFHIRYKDSLPVNGFLFKITNTSPWNKFYLDSLKIQANNINLVLAHKYEANFQNIWGLLAQGTDLYFSDLLAGKNYKAALNTTTLESHTGITIPINNNYLPNMPEDYQSNAPISYYKITKIQDNDMQSILGIIIDLLGKNGSVMQKHFFIK